MNKKEIVSVECIKHRYPDKTEVSICGLDFIVREGEKIALIGPNGSGKSTFLMHMMGLLRPDEGSVKVFGVSPSDDFNKIQKNIGVVVQRAEDQMIGPTVFDDIAFSLTNYGFSEEEIVKRVNAIMKEMKIEKLKDKLIHYLSGGEKKKVALAGALVLHPKLLILDEVMSEIDTESIDLILGILDRFNKEHETAIIMVTNEMGIVEKFADKVYLLDGGEIVFSGSFNDLTDRHDSYNVCRH